MLQKNNMSENQLNKDLLKFIKAFEPNKYKILRTGIEIRGMIDIHQSINLAKQLIDKLKLNLDIKHTAEMMSYKGFEVNVI
jgi:hypothetical protein